MQDVLSRVPPKGDHRIKYGSGDLQFGDLFLPAAAGVQSVPVMMFIHGGWWKNAYGLDYGGHLCAAVETRGDRGVVD